MEKEYSMILCSTIVVAFFVHYVFSILQLTKKDALTGLLNKHAYYATIDDMLKESDEMIYANIAKYYQSAGIDCRKIE